MSKTEMIYNILKNNGDILKHHESHPLSRRNPTVLIPHNCVNRSESILYAWVYKRYNDTRVLRLEITTPEREHVDIRELNQWVAQHTGTMPFATVRLICPVRDTAKLAVTHTMLVRDVSEASMAEVIDGLMFMFNKCSEKLRLMEQLFEDADPDDNDDDAEQDDESEDDEDDNEESEDSLNNRDLDKSLGLSAGNARIIEPKTQEAANEIFDQLNKLVGLEPVKQLVYQLAAQQTIAQKRSKRGLKAVVPSPHLVFTGNPGTGKTTVARLIGQLYKSLGLLSSGHVVEADRSSLVAAYLGQTALKTREVCKQALNGVLFIDEAYSLAVDGRDYGHEAIEALLTFMEDHRGEFVVVVAGYSDRMEMFLRSNPGLRSRFDQTLHFPDYSVSELVTMFRTLARENQYTLGIGTRASLTAHIKSWPRGEGFGNGREVRRLFNHVIGAHAASLAHVSNISTRQLFTITANLIPDPIRYEFADATSHHDDERLVGGYL
jgi:SpoVK/Ycf46/Vps4 family AAA+-type ATPase